MNLTASDRVHPVDGHEIRPFASVAELEDWLGAHHADTSALWIRFAKSGTGIASVTMREALESTMCFGWVDSKMHRVDDRWYVLRYAPRGPRSTWGPRNQRVAEALIAEGRMRPSGLATVDAAKAAGRWGR